ncbi:hypothetical protein DPMN_184586 [Dreissena polymorpha]|uniref:Uncharacterized protein n=1 Tax=Dreissena polymorpha TaxID=45954 RepID=A0A9D4I6I9_DREPO|nr:hypothetical protein DPMN_184586 [Dreissena polymorpha]
MYCLNLPILRRSPEIADVSRLQSCRSALIVFQGHQIRDDDEDEDYGGVVYIYNATNVIVATPKKANDRLGNSIYTGTCT